MNRRLLIRCLVPMLVLCAQLSGCAAPPMTAVLEAPVSSLCGRVDVHRAFGPPDYGETPQTDARVRAVVLALSAGLHVTGSADPALPFAPTRVDEVQLLGPATSLQALQPGDRICASGVLTQRVSGHHLTAVLLDVTTGRITPFNPQVR